MTATGPYIICTRGDSCTCPPAAMLACSHSYRIGGAYVPPPRVYRIHNHPRPMRPYPWRLVLAGLIFFWGLGFLTAMLALAPSIP